MEIDYRILILSIEEFDVGDNYLLINKGVVFRNLGWIRRNNKYSTDRYKRIVLLVDPGMVLFCETIFNDTTILLKKDGLLTIKRLWRNIIYGE